MGILNKILKRNKKADESSKADSIADKCIWYCKYAVTDKKGEYYCFVKKVKLYPHSLTLCSYYTPRKEARVGAPVCPDCKSDLYEPTYDRRRRCVRCGRIYT
jgi:hypothetical protein